MAAAFFLGQHVHFSRELRVRGDGARLRENLTAFHVFTLRAAQQNTDVVTGFAFVKQLTEHFHARAGRLLRGLDADDFDFVADADHTAFDTARHNGTAAGNREHVFDRHQERLIQSALRRRDVVIERFGELHDGLFAEFTRVAFQSELGRTLDDRDRVAREVVARQKFADFHFNELEQFRIVNHVALVQVDDDVGNTHLAGQKDVFTRLGHGAVSSGHNEDGAVHLGSTGNHVLHIVGVPRAVDVSVVALGGFVFNVSGVDRDAAGLFFRSRVDLVVSLGFAAELLGENRADSSSERRLTVVNVTDGADVNVRLGSFKFFLGHFLWSFLN